MTTPVDKEANQGIAAIDLDFGAIAIERGGNGNLECGGSDTEGLCIPVSGRRYLSTPVGCAISIASCDGAGEWRNTSAHQRSLAASGTLCRLCSDTAKRSCALGSCIRNFSSKKQSPLVILFHKNGEGRCSLPQ